jgi:hypothetical protein
MNAAAPVQFCPECGERVLEKPNDDTHMVCIAWGIKIGKYRGKADWIEACIKNGKRVTDIVGPL